VSVFQEPTIGLLLCRRGLVSNGAVHHYADVVGVVKADMGALFLWISQTKNRPGTSDVVVVADTSPTIVAMHRIVYTVILDGLFV
jgi:hypothetical protein